MKTPNRSPIELPAGANETLRRLVGRIAGRGGHAASPDVLAPLLLPMVRRAMQTGRGPMALSRRVARADPVEPSAVADLAARTLTANLVQLFLDPPEVQKDTIRN